MKTCLFFIFALVQINLLANQRVEAKYYWKPEDQFPPVKEPTGSSLADRISPEYAYVSDGSSKEFVAQPDKGWAVDHWRRSSDSFATYGSYGEEIPGSSGKLSWTWTYTSEAVAYLAVCFRWLNYKCVYAGEGDPLPTVSADTISYTNEFAIGAAPTRTGYEFAGWRDGSGKTWQPGDQVKGESFAELDEVHANGTVVTLTSQWTVRSYAIGTDAANCIVTVAPSADYTNDVAITWAPPTTAGHKYDFKSAKVFAGEKELTSLSSSGGTFNMSKAGKGYFESVTVKVVYEDSLESYSVSVSSSDSNKGTVAKDPDGSAYAHGSKVTLTATPEDGYAFEKWSDGGEQAHDVTVLCATNFVATFTNRVFILTFDPNGGTCGVESKLVTFGAYVGDLPKADRPKWQLNGWHRDPVLYSPVLSDERYEWTMDKTLYAHWTERPSYSIAYDGEGATNITMGVQTIFRDEETALTSNAFVRTGYAFKGWAETNDLTKVKYLDGTNVLNIAAVNETNELHAVWTANRYWVKFDKNGGTGEMPLLEFAYDEPKQLPDNEYKPQEHYEFLGWSEDKMATAASYTNRETVVNLWTEDGQTNTLYAVWKYIPSKWSEALDCTNLHFIDDVGCWEPVNKHCEHEEVGDNCLCCSNNAMSSVYAMLSSSGTLTFCWLGECKKKGFQTQRSKLTVDVGNDGNIFSKTYETDLEPSWLTETVHIDIPDGSTEELSFCHDGGVNNLSVWLDHVIWTPDEPTDPDPGPGRYGIVFLPGNSQATGSTPPMVCAPGEVCKLNANGFKLVVGGSPAVFKGWRCRENDKFYDDGILVFNLMPTERTTAHLEAVWEFQK